jgi:hypothetical protein
MKHQDELEWNAQMAAKKPNFVWSTDNSAFSLPIRKRQELAKFQKIRPCNVCLFDVIISVLKSIF